jgi:FMN phosphatase YigB (HAD superfamily)
VAGQEFDIDLHCMSYDAGYAKPDRRIFDAAEGMADQLLAAQSNGDSGRSYPDAAQEAMPWLKLYVGDEYEKDVLGARGAGWNSVFIGTGEDVPGREAVLSLDELGGVALEEVFPKDSSPLTVRTESTHKLLEWLAG